MQCQVLALPFKNHLVYHFLIRLDKSQTNTGIGKKNYMWNWESVAIYDFEKLLKVTKKMCSLQVTWNTVNSLLPIPMKGNHRAVTCFLLNSKTSFFSGLYADHAYSYVLILSWQWATNDSLVCILLPHMTCGLSQPHHSHIIYLLYLHNRTQSGHATNMHWTH